MDQVRKTYRIFISSCTKLLEEERNRLILSVLRKGHHPVCMEYGNGGMNTILSLSLDKHKIRESDCVVVILGHLYGEIIDRKIGGRKDQECPFSIQAADHLPHANCDSCYGETCHISFTHFEYLYALHVGKPVYVIVKEDYDNQDTFEKANIEWKKAGKKDCLTLWGQGREKNRLFVDSIETRHRFGYTNMEQFEKVCGLVLDTALDDLQKPDYCQAGLIPASVYPYLSQVEIFKPVIFFNQNIRPAETQFYETIKDARKFYFMARTGVTFLSRYSPAIKKAIDEGCECRFIILDKDSDVIKNGRYETAFDEKNAKTSLFYLKSLREYNPGKVSIHLTRYYPTFDIEYFEKRDSKKMVVVQSHFLISHLGPDRPMFMLYEDDYWYQTFKDELDEMWENTSEWREFT